MKIRPQKGGRFVRDPDNGQLMTEQQVLTRAASEPVLAPEPAAQDKPGDDIPTAPKKRK